MAVNPAILKLAAKAAFAVLLDEEAGQKAIISVLVPATGIILFIALIIQIITMPTQAIASFFSGENISRVEIMQQEYGYLQRIMENDADYQEGSGRIYSGLTFSSGATEVVYFNQLDERWKNKPYGKTDKIGTHGCGPTAMAIVISSLTGIIRNPEEMADWAYKNGYCCAGQGSYHTLIPGAAESFGLTAEGIKAGEPQKIADALSGGKLVVAIMSKGHFTSSGHFIVLRGITSEGQILVADPASKRRSEQEWDLSLICLEANKNAGAGGPFWAIGP